MVFRFGAFELDEAGRELRLNGREIALQPRIFDLLAYLVQHRDRVVGKEELLAALWPGMIVTEASLQRAVSLARAALRDGGCEEAIRTYSRQGYRFCQDQNAVQHPSPSVDTPFLDLARQAYENNEWDKAITGFAQADRDEGLQAEDLERWSNAAQFAGLPHEAVAPLERAVATHAMRGDRAGAARAALGLAQIQFDRREIAVAQGWHRRAGTYLDGSLESREHGLYEWLACRLALGANNYDSSVKHGEAAREIGRRLADPDVEALGLLYLGEAWLADGEYERGLAAVDEAATLIVSGDVSPWFAGLVFCGVIWVCLTRCDWGRAGQWAEQFARWCERHPASSYPGLCRMHLAEVLTVRGDLIEAEQEASGACSMLSMNAPWAEGDAYRVLGEIQLARGDLDAAEGAFRRAYELGWEPQPGYALLQVARGNTDAALRSLERALLGENWINRHRRGQLLAHLVIVAAVAGHQEAARTALEELDQHPELWSTPALSALLCQAWGEVALMEGHTEEGIASLREALDAWREIGAPLNVGSLRLRLAEVFIADGDAQAADLELSAAAAVFRKMGASLLLKTCQAFRASLPV